MADNHYQTLGISRDASADQIKKAYRKLARKYHPDISKEADAETHMQAINVAYDTLSDAEKKKQYDFELDHPQGFGDFGAGGQGGFDQSKFYRQTGGSAEQQADFSDFEDLFGRFGQGFGGADYQYQRANRQAKSFRGEDQHASLEVDVEIAFHGATQNITLQIPSLNAYGEPEVQRKTLQVKIPAGMKAGQQIRLSGQGQAGFNGGAAGDLYIEILYKQTDQIRVEGSDIYQQLKISPWEAALGQKIAITTPEGKTLEVQIPKNAHTGQQLRLKDKGIPNKTPGHLYLILNIVIPPANSEVEQQAYRDYAQAFQSFNPRQS
ncbi:DNA-binding protein [Acinetobacter sp. ANC 5054]|uniref:DnaJ C-terminal domain-containing protein n=1 Tax=Acinetobacter sp. ANC 5054 TaxID=1977877 RepID=UPI000A35A921|nr:DnaJ C-terminal domain-containing protein [Acinetobacter sp. ANC 5054]OTG84360.1 DNA-binding protein [Acinetobacter sp. ANC 5054]